MGRPWDEEIPESKTQKGKGLPQLVNMFSLSFPPSEEVVCSPDHEEQAELILPLEQNTQIVIQPTSQPQRHWESEEVRERSRERFTPIKTSQESVIAPRESNRCARHSDKPAAAHGETNMKIFHAKLKKEEEVHQISVQEASGDFN